VTRSVVRTTTGPVSGPVVAGVRRWRGIPYATAERFGPARPVAGWTAELDAAGPGPVGVQALPDGTLTGAVSLLAAATQRLPPFTTWHSSPSFLRQ